jgi:hypothetical protein
VDIWKSEGPHQLIGFNEQKIQDRLLANPAQNGTLQDLVKNEGAPGDKKRVATEGLMWLLRCVRALPPCE